MAVKRVPTTSKVISMLNERGLQAPVLDKDLTTPPSSPSTGDRYIVASGATGAWSGHDNDIAEWGGSSWSFTTPSEGYLVYIKDENDIYAFDGSNWIKPYGEGTGTGDMLKSVYDTDDDGIVDKAEKVDNGASSTLEIVDGTNPELKFTDKNGKFLSIRKDTDAGDVKKWAINLEDYDNLILFFDEYDGSFGFGNDFKVDGNFTTTGSLKIDDGSGNTFTVNTNSNYASLEAFGQGSYIKLQSDGDISLVSTTNIDSLLRPSSDNSVDLGQNDHRFKDLFLSGSISDGTNSATVADIKDAVDKKHSQNTDTYLDQGGANQVSASELRTALDTTIPSKADKVSGATTDNLASLDSNGNLQDSGIAKDDVILKDGSVAFTSPVSGVTPTANAHLATKSYVDSVAQGLDWQDSVLDKDLNTPPASPSTGDRYIVGSSPTGDWSGRTNDVAEWNGSSWDFTTPNEGFACWVEDEDALYVFNGTSWVQFGSTLDHGALQGLSDDDHPQYLNTTRGDARYYTQTQLDGGQLDNRYYTETEVDNLLNNKADKVSGATSGNLASLDANGNLQDAGIASSNVFDKSADDLDDISDGSTYGRVKLSELTSGQVNRLNDGSNIVTAAQGKKAYDTRAQYDASTDEIVFVDPDTYSG